MIEMNHISKIYRMGDYDLHALDDVSLSIACGEYIAVCGPSGSGKTTLMQIIGCIDFPDNGTYLLDSEDVCRCTDNELADIRNQKIGFVFQKFNLLPKFDALDNVLIPLLYRGIKREEGLLLAREKLEMVGLGNWLHHRPNQLSGGQQQRVAIARALVGDPAILLADEPTGNLDSQVGEDILTIFEQLHAAGKTVVVITHDPGIAERAERIIRLKDGRIVSSEPQKKRVPVTANDRS